MIVNPVTPNLDVKYQGLSLRLSWWLSSNFWTSVKTYLPLLPFHLGRCPLYTMTCCSRHSSSTRFPDFLRSVVDHLYRDAGEINCISKSLLPSQKFSSGKQKQTTPTHLSAPELVLNTILLYTLLLSYKFHPQRKRPNLPVSWICVFTWVKVTKV